MLESMRRARILNARWVVYSGNLLIDNLLPSAICLAHCRPSTIPCPLEGNTWRNYERRHRQQ
jgi:hypothetical protein